MLFRTAQHLRLSQAAIASRTDRQSDGGTNPHANQRSKKLASLVRGVFLVMSPSCRLAKGAGASKCALPGLVIASSRSRCLLNHVLGIARQTGTAGRRRVSALYHIRHFFPSYPASNESGSPAAALWHGKISPPCHRLPVDDGRRRLRSTLLSSPCFHGSILLLRLSGAYMGS